MLQGIVFHSYKYVLSNYFLEQIIDMMEYYIAIDGRQEGPFSLEEVLEKRLGCDDLVWHTGMAQWSAASELPELAAHFGWQRTTPPPLPRSAQEHAYTPAKPSRSPFKVWLYILFTVAVLLGGIYLGSSLKDAASRVREHKEAEKMEAYREQQRQLREQEEAERRRREQRIAELYAQDKSIQKHINELKERYAEAQEFHWFRLPSEKERQLREIREERDKYLDQRRDIRLELQSLGEEVAL